LPYYRSSSNRTSWTGWDLINVMSTLWFYSAHAITLTKGENLLYIGAIDDLQLHICIFSHGSCTHGISAEGKGEQSRCWLSSKQTFQGKTSLQRVPMDSELQQPCYSFRFSHTQLRSYRLQCLRNLHFTSVLFKPTYTDYSCPCLVPIWLRPVDRVRCLRWPTRGSSHPRIVEEELYIKNGLVLLSIDALQQSATNIQIFCRETSLLVLCSDSIAR